MSEIHLQDVRSIWKNYDTIMPGTSLILCSVLRQVHNILSTQCDLMLLLSTSRPSSSLRSSSNCLRLLPRIPVAFFNPPIFPSITYFRRLFLRSMWPIQAIFLLFIVCRLHLYTSTPLLSVKRLHFSHEQCNWPPSFSSTTFQNFPRISELLPQVSKFQNQTKPYSKCCTLLVSTWNLSPIYFGKSALLVERCFCHYNPGFSFTCTSCIICYHVTQIV